VKQRPGLEASQARDLPARDRRGCPNGTIPAMELIFVEKLSHALSATAILLTLRRNARALGSLLRSYRARPSLPPSTSSSSSSLHLSPSPLPSRRRMMPPMRARGCYSRNGGIIGKRMRLISGLPLAQSRRLPCPAKTEKKRKGTTNDAPPPILPVEGKGLGRWP
jgi:hypothetical protein